MPTVLATPIHASVADGAWLVKLASPSTGDVIEAAHGADPSPGADGDVPLGPERDCDPAFLQGLEQADGIGGSCTGSNHG